MQIELDNVFLDKNQLMFKFYGTPARFVEIGIYPHMPAERVISQLLTAARLIEQINAEAQKPTDAINT